MTAKTGNSPGDGSSAPITAEPPPIQTGGEIYEERSRAQDAKASAALAAEADRDGTGSRMEEQTICGCGHARRLHKGSPLRCMAPVRGKQKRCECQEFHRRTGTP